jgi:hypothetical protein
MARRADYFKNVKRRATEIARARTGTQPAQNQQIQALSEIAPPMQNNILFTPTAPTMPVQPQLPIPSKDAGQRILSQNDLVNRGSPVPIVKDFMNIFNKSFWDPQGNQPKPTRLERDQASVLRNAMGYAGNRSLNDVLNSSNVDLLAAIEAARNTTTPLKRAGGSPFADTKAGRKLKAQAAALNNVKKKK